MPWFSGPLIRRYGMRINTFRLGLDFGVFDLHVEVAISKCRMPVSEELVFMRTSFPRRAIFVAMRSVVRKSSLRIFIKVLWRTSEWALRQR